MKKFIALLIIVINFSPLFGQSIAKAEIKSSNENIDLSEVINNNPLLSRIFDLNEKGVEKFLQGNYTQAIELFNEALKLMPDLPAVKYNIGNALMEQGDYPAALEIFKTLTASNSDYANAYQGLGEVLYKMGRYEESISAYRRKLELSANDYIALTYIGDALFQLNRYEDALVPLTQAIKLQDDYVTAYNNRAVVLIKLGRNQEALADLEKALSVDNSVVQTYNNLGVLYRKLNKPKKAQKYFLEAVKLKPDWSLGLFHLSLTYLETREYDKVRHYQNQLSKLDKKLADDLNRQLLNRFVINLKAEKP